MTNTKDNIDNLSKKFNDFFKMYQIMGSMLNEMPIHPEMIKDIRKDFDTGFLWLKESVIAAEHTLKIQADQSSQAPIESEIVLDADVTH